MRLPPRLNDVVHFIDAHRMERVSTVFEADRFEIQQGPADGNLPISAATCRAFVRQARANERSENPLTDLGLAAAR